MKPNRKTSIAPVGAVCALAGAVVILGTLAACQPAEDKGATLVPAPSCAIAPTINAKPIPCPPKSGAATPPAGGWTKRTTTPPAPAKPQSKSRSGGHR
jgi:hypothetical protein